MTEIAVHPMFAAAGGFGHLRLGRVTPPEEATPKVALDPFVAEAFEPPPAEVDYYTIVPSWPMYGNDELGDCTWATVGHLVQAWTALAGQLRTPAEADIEEGYWETGTPPSKTGTAGGPTDDGRMEPHVLAYWRHNGIPNETDSIIGYAAVNAKNAERVKFTVANFGGAYVALAMPVTAESQSVWDYVADTPDNEPYSWGGHAVPILGYDADYLYVVTWGFVMKMTWAFWAHYGVACYAVISPDFVGKAQAAGVDTDGLQAHIQSLTSEAAGGDLPTDTPSATAAPDPAPEPASGPETQPDDPSWIVSTDWHFVVGSPDPVGAKTLFLRNLAENPNLIQCVPANEATAPAE